MNTKTILNGCGEKESLGDSGCNKGHLCEICSAKAQTYADCFKDELKFLEDKLATKINIIDVQVVDESFVKENICPTEKQRKKLFEKDIKLGEISKTITYGKKWARKEFKDRISFIKSELKELEVGGVK